MNIWRLSPAVVGMHLITTSAFAEQVITGTWALEDSVSDGAYLLASSGTDGQYVICFSSGNVRTVSVRAGSERSLLARGGCTVFAATNETGIVVDFASEESTGGRNVALGTFVMMVPEAPE